MQECSLRSFPFVLAFSLSQCCIRWVNTSKKTDAAHFSFPCFFFSPLAAGVSPVVVVVISTDAAANWPRMRRNCPGTTERWRSLRCRRCWQGSRARDHCCLSSTGGGLQPPPALRVCVRVSFCLLFFSACTGQKLWSGTGAPRGETKRARHARGPRARPRNFFFFFFPLLRINPEDAMCRSETGHHISCCCRCRHEGSAGREDRGRRAREKRHGERLCAVAATQRGQLHRMTTGLGALRGGFDARSRI